MHLLAIADPESKTRERGKLTAQRRYNRDAFSIRFPSPPPYMPASGYFHGIPIFPRAVSEPREKK